MELIVISEEKMKIILDKEDMEKMNISADELDYNKTDTKRVLWEILSHAKRTQGFDTDNSKLFVQVFPSLDGGCELFVTKVPSYARAEREISEKSSFKIISKSKTDNGILVLLDFDELCELCKRTFEKSPLLISSLYRDFSGKYILHIERPKQLPSYYNGKAADFPPFLPEYGEIKCADGKAISYLNEHCKLLISDSAISVISEI